MSPDALIDGLLADTDGDSLPDAVHAMLLLGSEAALPEHLAAINIAARLGFESLALREQIVSFSADDMPAARWPVYIGRPATLDAGCPAPLRALCEELRAGEGAIALIQSPAPALLVGGADVAGLAAAAHALAAGALPDLWERTGGDTPVLAVRVPGMSESVLPPAGAPDAPPLRSLADLYGPAGLAVDQDGDLLPERPRARVIVPPDLSPAEVIAAVQLGARIGLEALGVALPLATGPDEQDEGAQGRISISIEPLAGPAAEGQGGTGWIRLGATGEGQRLRVGGSDTRGRAAALRELARLDAWTTGERASLATIEHAIERLCALADPGAALCAAGSALRRLAAAAPAPPGEPLNIRVALPEHSTADAAAVTPCLTRWAEMLIPGGLRSASVERRRPPILFEETRQFAWEMDEAWDALEREVLPAIAALPRNDAEWRIDVRISEPEGRRRQLQHATLDRIRATGRAATAEQVRVLPAYFQGRAWLLEVLLPRLLQVPVRRILVRVQRFAPEYPSLELPIRWLQDLFPVDELLAERLHLPIEAIAFAFDDPATTYEVVAHDEQGGELLRSGLDVVHGTRPYLPGFPAWGAVHPPTGCVRLLHAGNLLIDRRLAPDPERVWDYVQEDLLPQLARQISATCAGAPRPDRQPFFGDLSIDVWLSEEDTPLGIREERISPLESLQEDLYFMLLDYCTALMSASGEGEPYLPPWIRPPAPGQPRRGARLWTAPGRIVPRIHRRDGAAGQMRVQLTEARNPRPALQWTWGSAHGSEPLATAEISSAAITGIEVQANAADPERPARCLHLTLGGDDAAISGARLLLEGWADLRGADPAFDFGIPRDISFRVRDSAGTESLIPAVPGAPAEAGSHERRTAASSRNGQVGGEDADGAASAGGDSSVPWDRVLGADAIAERVRALGRLPHAHAFVAGRSAQGRPAYAVELTVPRRDGCWSRAKLSGWKCTLLLNARHHANEPSSTNALLRLAELLAADPEWQRYLARVNVILAPGENADGMALYQELQDEHPTWMHHAARYNGAGMEYTSQYANPRTIHTEALVMPMLWRRWAPDIYCDDHGFPAHAWVQPFAGHGNPWFRDYWTPQALVYAYLPCASNARYPRHPEAADALQRRMVDALASDEQVASWNARHADRYVAYLHRWLPEQFPAPYERGVLIHRSTYDPEDPAQRQGSLSGLPGHLPGVTTASITTEVADETAQGRYMALCAHAHLLLDRVLLDYLYDANAPASIQRQRLREAGGRTLLLARRARPVVV